MILIFKFKITPFHLLNFKSPFHLLNFKSPFHLLNFKIFSKNFIILKIEFEFIFLTIILHCFLDLFILVTTIKFLYFINFHYYHPYKSRT